MSSNLPLVRQSCRVLPFLFFIYGQGGHKLEINTPPQQIFPNSKGRLIIKGVVILSESGTVMFTMMPKKTEAKC